MTEEEEDLLRNALKVHFCNAAGTAFSDALAFVVGGGEFSLEQAGNYGAVKTIDLQAGLLAATLVWAQASAEAEADADASAYVFASTANCEALYPRCGICYMLCAYATGRAQAGAIAKADAKAFGAAAAQNYLGTETQVSVEGQNLQEFDATVSAHASSFAVAAGSASAQASLCESLC